MMNVAIDSHLQSPGQSLEDSFYLMMLILALSLNIQVDTGCIAE